MKRTLEVGTGRETTKIRRVLSRNPRFLKLLLDSAIQPSRTDWKPGSPDLSRTASAAASLPFLVYAVADTACPEEVATGMQYPRQHNQSIRQLHIAKSTMSSTAITIGESISRVKDPKLDSAAGKFNPDSWRRLLDALNAHDLDTRRGMRLIDILNTCLNDNVRPEDLDSGICYLSTGRNAQKGSGLEVCYHGRRWE